MTATGKALQNHKNGRQMIFATAIVQNWNQNHQTRITDLTDAKSSSEIELRIDLISPNLFYSKNVSGWSEITSGGS